MDRFIVSNIVGEGSFGKVYKAIEKSSNSIVALKVIGKRGRSSKELKSLRKECEIQSQLKHPNIIQMLESFETENEIVVVTEYAKGDLHSLLAREGSVGEERAQKLTFDLVSALYYLHSHRILHRDLKPQNILLDENEVAKLCDFGLARNMTTGTHVLTSIKGTPLYMAPELMAEKPYDHQADLWSLGCIIYEVLAGQPPFCTRSILQLLNLIRHEHVKWPSFLSGDCISFLQGLLEKDPNLRMTWSQILNHPFVKGNIYLLKEDIPESPFTQSMTESQSREKEKQTNKILYGTRSPFPQSLSSGGENAAANIKSKPQSNMAAAAVTASADENITSSRDSVHAMLQSDMDGVETDTDAESVTARQQRRHIGTADLASNKLVDMFADINLNEICFVTGNSNLIVNHLHDNFPPNGGPSLWNQNYLFQYNLHNQILQQQLLQQQQLAVNQANNVQAATSPSLSQIKQTTNSANKSKVKHSELEKRKLSQNLDNFSLRLSQSQDNASVSDSNKQQQPPMTPKKSDAPAKATTTDAQSIVAGENTVSPQTNKQTPNMLPGWDSCDESQSPPIENDEWIAFLQRSMQEVLDGELDSLKQQNLVSIIVSPLRNAKACCKVIESVAQLLSLPLILCGSTALLSDIQKVYAEVKLVPNLVYASKLLCSKMTVVSPSSPLPTSPVFDIESIAGLTMDQVKTVSTLYELVCHLVHLDQQFLTQFCDAIAILRADKLLIDFLGSITTDNPIRIRLVNNVIALLSCAIRELPENAELIEKIIFNENVDVIKLLQHDNILLRSRMCMLFGLLGRFSCRALQSNWTTGMREAFELLACDENDEVKTEAKFVLEEFKHLSFYCQSDTVY